MSSLNIKLSLKKQLIYYLIVLKKILFILKGSFLFILQRLIYIF